MKKRLMARLFRVSEMTDTGQFITFLNTVYANESTFQVMSQST